MTKRKKARKAKPLPVVFRWMAGQVCAYFPTMTEPNGEIGSYAHVGQHSAASPVWLRKGRAATMVEYAPLLAELRQIYETYDADHVELKVYKRAPARR